MTSTVPNTARGQATITIAGKQYPVRFTLNVLRDWTKLTGQPASEFGLAIVRDHIEAFSGLIMCAVRRFVPAYPEYTQEQAVDLLDDMAQAEADQLAEAIAEAATMITPLLASMNQQFATKAQVLNASTPTESGAPGTTLDSAS